MSDIVISDADHPSRNEVIELYASVGWTAYTASPDTLMAALAGSLRLVTARVDERLVGLARLVGDGATIAYLQDVLVEPGSQRLGVGAALIKAAFEPYTGVRQHLLLTDDEPGQRDFYQSLGFSEIRDFGEGTLRAFVRFA